ncbi:hypothetical protein QVD99_005432 [Batrachochytrium dendrobatidis]|nr:hypothetical protein O5D80_004232 [Batrachochytrium dendrobatidis]KAK5668413.1 hypothetical protein QVD99_005432 [Batrachochytrium dendrobatidis]
MENFKSKYTSKCAELSIQPLTTVLDTLARRKTQIDEGNSDTLPLIHGPNSEFEITTTLSPKRQKSHLVETLNLSGQSIPLKAGSALASALSDDCFFTRLVLADAFLGDDGCILVASALKSNTTVTYLDLRGNSIRADGAIALGQMLKVNSTLKSLNLEWNCVGIWEAGVKSIADALTLNQSLEELDLRNNKIGPQASQHVALSLKHNTRLRRLDYRWNNAGLIGGRAFLDLLKWNTTLTDLNLTGNEIPEDTHRGIVSALERNNDRYKHDLYTKAHTQGLTTTLQTLTQSHHDALSQLTSKLVETDQNAQSMSKKLSLASAEISESQEAYAILEAKLSRVMQEKTEFENRVIQERTQSQKQVTELQQELVTEREKRMRAEDTYQTLSSGTTTRVLKLESSLKQAELDVEVLKRDKVILLEDVAAAKEKERSIASLWEEKLQRYEATSHGKLMKLQNLKEEEMAERCKKHDERCRQLETECSKAQEEVDLMRNKLNNEKRHWAELLSQTEARIHKEEEARRNDIELQYQNMHRQRDALQTELSSAQAMHAQIQKEHDAAIKRLHDQRMNQSQELSDLQARDAHHMADITQLRVRLEEARKEAKEAHEQLIQFQSELNRIREASEREKKDVVEREKRERKQEHETILKQISARDSVISRLKEELRRRDDEMEARDEENIIRMKELQLNINTLLTQRTRKHNRTKSTDFELSVT